MGFGRRLVGLVRRGGLRFPAAMAILAFLTLSPQRAEAIYGFGDGFFNFQYTPPAVTFLNERSLAMTNLATMGPVQNNVYAGNPNAWSNRLNGPGYLDKYDIDTKRAIEHRVARNPSTPRPRPQSQPAAPAPVVEAAPPAAPILPLISFFDRYSKLVWPSDAPDWGDLKEKRSAADLAVLAVLNDSKLNGLASLRSVTTARTDLIGYGQPALQYIRTNSTPRIADGFHLFLLSLYDSIGQAATQPMSAPAPKGRP